MNNFFSITINTYNHGDWIEKCIRSCISQKYPNFEVLVLDDISTDRTWEICEELKKEFSEKLKIKQNNQKIYSQVKNILSLTHDSQPGSIVISIDGDDWLKNDEVLTVVDQIYQNEDVWITYGSYEEYPSGFAPPYYHAYPPDIIANNAFREYNWVASHLRTFRRELFLKIKEEDFKLENGEWLDVTGDQAFMLPMLEMAAERSRFIPDVLYSYNVANLVSFFSALKLAISY